MKIRKVLNIGEKSVSFQLVTRTTEDEDWQVLSNLKVMLKDLNEDLVTRAALHGLSQKLGDSYAGVKSNKEKFSVASAEWKRLVEEQSWNKKSRTAEPKMKVSEVEAGMREQGINEETIKAVLGSAYIGPRD